MIRSLAPKRLAIAVLAITLLSMTMLSPRPTAASGGVGIITTFAGGGGTDGAPATGVVLGQPVDVAVDPAGALYITVGCRIRKVADGTIATVVGNGSCDYGGDGGPATEAGLAPLGIAFDGAGNLYIADAGSCRIRKVSAGVITTVAGDGLCFYGGDGGSATSASLNPRDVAVDDSGTNIYIADTGNCRIRRVNSGTISTYAGNGTCAYAGDGGTATNASFYAPVDVATNGSGDVFIADEYACRIRQVSNGTIATVAGSATCGTAGDGGPATSASIDLPRGVGIDAEGSIYIADTGNCRVRKVSGGTMTAFAGAGGACVFSGDGGPATSAYLSYPQDVAADNLGAVYIADTYNCSVRKVVSGTITTVAGTGFCTFGGDGLPPTDASLNNPAAVAVDGTGRVYISDSDNCRVRVVDNGIISTVAGSGYCAYFGDGGTATRAGLYNPQGIAVDDSGLYIADIYSCRIRRVSAGIITTFAGNGSCISAGDGGPATSAGLSYPKAVAIAAGVLYIAEGCRIREVSGGTITTVAGNGSCGFSGDGGPAIAAGTYAEGVAVDGSGNMYIADKENCRVRKVSAGIISTAAGNGTCWSSGDGGPPTNASLFWPVGLAVDSGGDLYIAESNTCVVRRVLGGTISTVAGQGCGFGGDGGEATTAMMSDPLGLAVTPGGELYIADTGNDRVRLVGVLPPRDHKTDANGDGYSAADEETIANCGAVSCANVISFGTSETNTCKDGVTRHCGTPGAPADDSAPVREAPPPADGYGCDVTLDTIGPKTTKKLAQSDIDLDGVVTILDLSKVAGWFGNTINPSVADPRWEGDLDGDGHITILDLSAMASNFGRSVAGDCQPE
jgi:sugar lactone lactonase YvrE